MKSRDLSIGELADLMLCEEELVAHLLTGKVPPELFDTGLIQQIARVTDYDVSVIARFIGKRGVVPTDKLLDSQENEIQVNFRRVLDEFVEILQKGHSTQLSKQQRDEYNKVIYKLEGIIARQKRDLDLVERLKQDLENLENLDRPVSIDQTDTGDMLRRIIRIYEQHEQEEQEQIS